MRRSVWRTATWWLRAREESGQTMAEYATLLGVLIIAVAASFVLLAGGIASKLGNDLATILSAM